MDDPFLPLYVVRFPQIIQFSIHTLLEYNYNFYNLRLEYKEAKYEQTYEFSRSHTLIISVNGNIEKNNDWNKVSKSL